MYKQVKKTISIVILVAFFSTSVKSPAFAQLAQEGVLPQLPVPGVMVHLSPEFSPAHLQGITIHPENALQFDFLINKGDLSLQGNQRSLEYTKLIKYFLASLTIPDEDQWVNLSPYEKNRIIKDDFGKTEMGRDLLAEDYLLKQITSSLIYPEDGLGKKFWDKIYERAWKEYHTTDIPVNTFNKVWIVPDQAIVYESGNTAYILSSHLKVMLEEDYMSLQKHAAISSDMANNDTHVIGSQVTRQIILPELEKEVNEGKNFASLRQMYSGMVLATWYKRALKQSLLGMVYANKAKVAGMVIPASSINAIYQRYIKAFKKGVFNYIKEDIDKYTNESIPRKYFSGGFVRDVAMDGEAVDVKVVHSTDALPAGIDYASFSPSNSIDYATVALAAPFEKEFLRLESNGQPGDFARKLPVSIKKEPDPVRFKVIRQGQKLPVFSNGALIIKNNGMETILRKNLVLLATRPFRSTGDRNRDNFLMNGSLAYRGLSKEDKQIIFKYLSSTFNEGEYQKLRNQLETFMKGANFSNHWSSDWPEEFKHSMTMLGTNNALILESLIDSGKFNQDQLKAISWILAGINFNGDKAMVTGDSFGQLYKQAIGRIINDENVIKLFKINKTLERNVLDAQNDDRFSYLVRFNEIRREINIGLSRFDMPKIDQEKEAAYLAVAKQRAESYFDTQKINPKRILIIEDELDKRNMLQATGEHYGLQVTVADNGEKALTILKNNDFDIILTDGDLGGMTGPEVLKEITSNPEYSGRFANTVMVLTSGLSGKHMDAFNEVQSKHKKIDPKPGYPFIAIAEALEQTSHDRAMTLKPLLHRNLGNQIPLSRNGGIDLNSANLNLQIRRDGRGVPLPVAQQDMAQLMNISGFVPVIIEIKPAVNLPIMSELQQKLQSTSV